MLVGIAASLLSAYIPAFHRPVICFALLLPPPPLSPLTLSLSFRPFFVSRFSFTHPSHQKRHMAFSSFITNMASSIIQSPIRFDPNSSPLPIQWMASTQGSCCNTLFPHVINLPPPPFLFLPPSSTATWPSPSCATTSPSAPVCSSSPPPSSPSGSLSYRSSLTPSHRPPPPPPHSRALNPRTLVTALLAPPLQLVAILVCQRVQWWCTSEDRQLAGGLPSNASCCTAAVRCAAAGGGRGGRKRKRSRRTRGRSRTRGLGRSAEQIRKMRVR